MSTDAVSGYDVTVMLCAYQAADTITTALASIAAQSERVGTVVVVDDGSTDRTVQIVSEWSDRLPIDLVRLPENRGHSAARMIAEERCTTRLIAILDADDAWLPDHVATLVGIYRSSPGIVAARELLWVPGVGVTAARGPEREVPPVPRQLRQLLRADFVPIGSLFAADDLRRAGGFRDMRAEDWDLWIRMVRRGVEVTRADHPTYVTRVHADSLTYGDTHAIGNVEVLDRAVAEAATPAERRAAQRSRWQQRGALELLRSYESARDGLLGRARRRALTAVRLGDRRVKVRAAWMTAAPKSGSRIHDRRIADPGRWVER
jgi:glycosyltransferase involved in cell wall biosynthesis